MHKLIKLIFGKSHRKIFSKNLSCIRASSPGVLIHIDICDAISVLFHGGSLYYILFQDNSIRYQFIFCISQKLEAFICFQKVCKTIFRDTRYEVLTL